VYTSGTQAAKTRYNVIQSDGTFKDLNEIFAIPKGITWVAMGTGTNSEVFGVHAVDNSNVYVGGTFSNLGGDPNKKFIVKWDGATWQSMGSDMNNNVFSIYAYDNSNVYVGGAFTNVGGDINKQRIVKWNGSTWVAMGSGITFGNNNGSVRTIYALDNSNVYVGGVFINAGGNSSADYIAKWDGGNWRAMGTGMNGQVSAIFAQDVSNVYAGGFFTLAGGVSNTNYLAKWNGNAWKPMGAGVGGGGVVAISALDNSNVYVGGYFTSALNTSGVSVANTYFIAKWDGTAWVSGTGIGSAGNVNVGGISAVDNSNVYICGTFARINNVSDYNNVAKWDGTTWQKLGSGVPSRVNAISALDNANVFIGGTFINISNNSNAAYVAKWTNNY